MGACPFIYQWKHFLLWQDDKVGGTRSTHGNMRVANSILVRKSKAKKLF